MLKKSDFDWLVELWEQIGRESLQTIGLWSQSKSGLTESDQLLKEEFTGHASTTKSKFAGSNG